MPELRSMPVAAPSRRRRLGLLLLLSPLWACQAQPPLRQGIDAEQALQQRISAEVGSAACSSSADCRSLPIGSKACGGPARWLAWSAAVSNPDLLLAWSQDLAQRQRQREMTEGRMSTCSVVPDPGTQCVAGRCVLTPGKPMN
jgi:hypothetical protein